jgi:type I restriction enzyme S subunit
MLYRHLFALGYSLRNIVKSSGQHGPDFCFDHEGRTIWIEAVVPAPEGIPAEWLEPPRIGECRVKTMPPEQMLLRCTTAIDAKRNKLDEYRAKGIIAANDCTVVAVNICRLSDWDIDGNGISQLPLVMEAVFSIGPLDVPISRDGKPNGTARHMPRHSIKKENGTDISTGNFLDPLFANMGAVMQGHQKDLFEKTLDLSVIHNPLANNRLPTGLLGARKEFVAEEQGDHYKIRDLASRGD